MTFDSEIRALVRASSNPSHLKQLLHVMEHSASERKTSTGPIFHDLAERFKKRGIVMVLSDLFDDVDAMMAGLKHLRHRRHEVILMHVLDPAEMDFPFDADDALPRPGAIARRAGRAAGAAQGVSGRVPSLSAAAEAGCRTQRHRLRARCGPINRWRWRCRVIWRREDENERVVKPRLGSIT